MTNIWDFNNDITFGEGDNFLDFATSSATSSANTAKQVKNYLGRKSQGIQNEEEINNDNVQSKLVDSSDINSGRVKKAEPFKFKAKPLIKFNPHIDARIEKLVMLHKLVQISPLKNKIEYKSCLREQEEKIRKQKEEELFDELLDSCGDDGNGKEGDGDDDDEGGGPELSIFTSTIFLMLVDRHHFNVRTGRS
ncbi:hypothetical protein C1646_769869 [Rhizophagus diaphanus]|nr:hypothetical protein C1646_769869 [Rhizophagus diaphanus] [Rhizophagus sp. MUCL 43196]